MCSLAVPVEACSKVSAIAYLMLAQHLQPSAPLGQSVLGRKPGEQVSLVLLRKSIWCFQVLVLQLQHSTPFIEQHQDARPVHTCHAGSGAACRSGALCAPCGAALTGHSVALTFSYEYFDVVALHTEFEVRQVFSLLQCWSVYT